MDAQRFDAAAAWKVLEKHLDALGVPVVAAQIGLALKTVDGHRGPAICPRYVCRSPRAFTVANGWACPTCGALGGGAAVFAASIAGWSYGAGEDDAEVRADFSSLAREALFSGLVDAGDPKWLAFYDAIPGFEAWTVAQRGVFEGGERIEKAKALAVQLAKARFPGVAIARQLWAWSCTYCRPPLTRGDLAQAFSDAAGGSL